MKPKKKRHIVFLILVVLVVTSIVYNIYDNGRFIVVEQDISISKLPKDFDGYRILQISDLHSQYFGDNQEELISAINSLEYDCIVFTGDMNKDIESDLPSSQAVIDLIEGIQKKDTMLWVDGNTGPFAIEALGGSHTGEVTSIGEQLEKKGVQILLSPVRIEKNGQNIWFVPELSKMDILMNYSSVPEDRFENSEQYEKVIAYGNSLQEWYEQLNNNGDVKIRINHFPMQANLSKEQWDSTGYLDYALSICGHYHGGQVRVPFYGALYIPSPTSGIHNGYFPNQKEVKGLNQIAGMQQYISAGLGASNSIAFLDFRIFDTPEINLITLHSIE